MSDSRKNRKARKARTRVALLLACRFDDLGARAHLRYMELLRLGPCSYCGKPAARRRRMRTLDHIVPVSANRGWKWHNLTPACKPCNSRKGSQSLLMFLVADMKRQASVTGVFAHPR